MSKDIAENVYYREVQRFNQWWLWLLIIGIAGLLWYGFIQQIVFGTPFGSKPAPDAVMWIFWIIFGISFPLLFYATRLIVKVSGDAIYVRFFPFHLRFQKIPLAKLKDMKYVRTYSPIKDYGGWGIRYGLKGKAYNVSGNRGVQLELLNGERILIGSQKPEELAVAIDSALKSHDKKE
jgi:hypothetical protein